MNSALSKKLKHLLLPGEHRVYCRPNQSAGDLTTTIWPSKVTCANCLGKYKFIHTGKRDGFRVAHVAYERFEQ